MTVIALRIVQAINAHITDLVAALPGAGIRTGLAQPCHTRLSPIAKQPVIAVSVVQALDAGIARFIALLARTRIAASLAASAKTRL